MVGIINYLPENTRSPETLALAQKWINECFSQQEQCSPAPKQSFSYPTRLLQCGPFYDSNIRCRLIETKQIALEGPYMTLSHCRGDTDCLKLTTENYLWFTESIDMNFLPRLYQDALEVACYFGVKYLWIDSLCIIQDGGNHQDWRREAKLMGDVYRYSHCHISAANAVNSEKSLFTTRFWPSVAQLIIQLNDGNLYRIMDRWFWQNEVHEALINTQGWVLQRRLLSPRMLYFGNRQILWECLQKDAAEFFPDGLTTTDDVQLHCTGFKQYALPRTLPGPTIESNLSVYDAWARILDFYTRCNLSVSSNKLVALSGVAKEMEGILKDQYVAGMWLHQLEYGLLWYIIGHFHRPPITRAPSWSWASVDGQISDTSARYGRKTLYFSVLAHWLDYETDDHTGFIRGGSLELRGHLGQLAFHWDCIPLGTIDRCLVGEVNITETYRPIS